MWNCQTPGHQLIVEKNNDLSSKSIKEFSNNFTVLKIEINHVDQLLLRKPVHIRTRWIRANEWKEE